MRGCLVYTSLLILGLIFLVSLIGVLFGSTSSFLTAVFIAVLIGLILYSEKQRKKLENQRKKEALEQEQRNAIIKARKERKNAIIKAREKPNLFKFKPSTDLEDLSRYEQQGNPVKLAEALQRRYKASNSALNDAMLVINDDIEQLHQYREKLQKGIMKDYELVIQPFKQELINLGEKIPKPKELKIAENYVFPNSLQPASIHQSINMEMSSTGARIGNQVSRLISNNGGISKIKNINKGEAAITAIFIGIELAITEIRRRKATAEKLTEVKKLKADINASCEEISGAIKGLGMAADEIGHLRQLHDNAVDYLMKYYDSVKSLSDQNSSLETLDKKEIQTVEMFYMGGKHLARLMQVDITKLAN